MGRFLLRSFAAIAMLSLIAFGITALAAAMPVALLVLTVVAVSLTLATIFSLPFMYARSNAPTMITTRPSTVVHTHPTVVPGPTVILNRPYVTPIYSRPLYHSTSPYISPRYPLLAERSRQNIVVAAPTPISGRSATINTPTVHGRVGMFNTTRGPVRSVPLMPTPINGATVHGRAGMFNTTTQLPMTARAEQQTNAKVHSHR